MFYLLYYTEDMDLKKGFILIHCQIIFLPTNVKYHRDEVITL